MKKTKRPRATKAAGRKRDYKAEYKAWGSSDKAIKRRSQRNQARAKMEKAGKVRKGDGKDVHHRDHNTANNKASNLAVMSKSKNRSMNTPRPKRRRR